MDPPPLQLQIPQFLYNTAPTLVPGGGAEVIPLTNPSWFAHNGFLLDPNSFFAPPPVDYQQPVEEQSSSSAAPFEFEEPQPFPSAQPPPAPTPDLSIFLKQPDAFAAPSPLGLPVYSASGFDLLSILARVATRPNPQVVLGPVDLTCSFVVVDTRRFDYPVVYCSPTFCALTGYSEAEIIGRNCRFLQAPGGNLQRGEPRKHTSLDAVALLRKALVAGKECQTSIVNYKKDGSPFINLVTIIPVPGGVSGAPHEENECAYHVGFQVDLTQQPHAILEKLRDGSYLVNYGVHSDIAPVGLARDMEAIAQQNQSAKDRKANAIPPIVFSKELKRLMADPVFLRSIPLSTSTTVPPPTPSATTQEDALGANHLLHLLLLEAAPDFIHVVSLKGSFLYVAPSVRRVLGYEPEEMVGGSISDYAHPEDVIPIMRELKEASALGPAENPNPTLHMPRSVDLLFRAKTKMGRYVWVECRGRLHVEPGKGRKAIVLSGRAREMANLKWEDVKRAGGLAKGTQVGIGKNVRTVEQEVWGMLAGNCKDTMSFMSAGRGLEDVLGWTSEDLLGRSLTDIMVDDNAMTTLGDIVSGMRAFPPVDGTKVKKLHCSLKKKDGGIADVWFIVYRVDPDDEEHSPRASLSISPAPLVYQIRLVDAETLIAAPASMMPPTSTPSPSPVLAPSTPPPVPSVDMFEELAISRGSSWQYELQQLRFANVRLQEELTALEAATPSSPEIKSSTEAQDPYGYEPLGTLAAHLQPEPSSDSRPPPPFSLSPVSKHTTHRAIHPRPPAQIQQEWSVLSTYVPAASVKKRHWDASNS